MDDNKLKISAKKYRGETMVVSSRLSSDLVNKIDKIAEDTGRTRNELIQLFLEYSIEHLEIDKD